MQYYIDHIVASRGWRSERLILVAGGLLTIEGWACDAAGRMPTAVTAMVDGQPRGAGTCGIERPDVATSLGKDVASRFGFHVEITSDGLGVGDHGLELVFEFGEEPRRHEMTPPYAFEIASSDAALPPPTGKPRIIVAAAPKSGSSYAAGWLRRYYDLPELLFHDRVFLQEHVLTNALIADLGDRPFVLQLHLWPRAANVDMLRALCIAPVVTWRNLADTVISYDDHVRKEGTLSAAGLFTYVGDRGTYLALPDQRRYQFLIRNMLPWYIGFYLGWRDVRAPLFMRYEHLVKDSAAYFNTIVQGLSGEVDPGRVRETLAAPLHESRFNVGVNGRSVEKMSSETKALLEETLAGHYEDLTPLIDELPWRQPVWDRTTPMTPAWTLPG